MIGKRRHEAAALLPPLWRSEDFHGPLESPQTSSLDSTWV